MGRRRRIGRDQRELVARAKAGDREAVEELLAEVEPFVKKLAAGYLQRVGGQEYEDLVQMGRIGVFSAIEGFEPERGLKFLTFAYYKILGHFSAGRRTSRLIRLPDYVLSSPRGRAANPDPAYVARSLDEVVATHGSTRDVEVTLGEMLIAEEDTEAMALASLGAEWSDLREAVAALPDREREVIHMRFGFGGGGPRTLLECSEALGMSREGIRHVEVRAIRRLRLLLGETQ